MAVGVINSLMLEGLRVPDDVSVVGTDDSTLARMNHRNLTSVSQRLPAFAKYVVELAVERIEGSLEPSADVVVDPELVIRTSTAPPRVPAHHTERRPAASRQRIGDGAAGRPALPKIAHPFKVSFD